MDFDPVDANMSNEARADVDDYGTESSSTLQQYNNMPFSAQLGFDFPNRSDSSVQSRGTTTQHNSVPSSTSLVTTSTASTLNNTSVPEFLYQLTKMLTENNNDVIEWSHGKIELSIVLMLSIDLIPRYPLTFRASRITGRIEVHSPQKLESDVLKKYFRHSKFASFQRQLNYFGFRKLAGKGKMAPCSYVNDAAMDDISSLFQIKVCG